MTVREIVTPLTYHFLSFFPPKLFRQVRQSHTAKWNTKQKRRKKKKWMNEFFFYRHFLPPFNSLEIPVKLGLMWFYYSGIFWFCRVSATKVQIGQTTTWWHERPRSKLRRKNLVLCLRHIPPRKAADNLATCKPQPNPAAGQRSHPRWPQRLEVGLPWNGTLFLAISAKQGNVPSLPFIDAFSSCWQD